MSVVRHHIVLEGCEFMVWCVSPCTFYTLKRLLPCATIVALATILSTAIAGPAQAQFADSTSEPSQSSQDQRQSQAVPQQQTGALERLDLDDRQENNASQLPIATPYGVVGDGTMTIAQFVPVSEPYPIPPARPSVMV